MRFIRAWDRVSKFRRLMLFVTDILLLSGSYGFAWLLVFRRIDLFEYTLVITLGYLAFALLFMSSYWLFGMYESLWRYADAYEFVKCILASILAGFLFAVTTWHLISPNLLNIPARIPLSVYWVAIVGAGVLPLLLRTAYRAYRTHSAAQIGRSSRKVLVIGTSDIAAAAIAGLKAHPAGRYDVVCAVSCNGDMTMQGRRIHMVPISGTVEDIPQLVAKHGIQMILFATRELARKQMQRIYKVCEKTSCELKKVPDLFDFEVSANVHIRSRIEDVSVLDLLGREEVNTLNVKLPYLTGQVVLITGAGGTIGQELCRQAAANGVRMLVMVDVVENGLYEIEQELIFTFGTNLSLAAQVASVRERSRIAELFELYRPDLVFHAAAHKHVPLMEAAPWEAVKNNILGTLNTAVCAEEFGARRFVLISSDKAVNPTSVYGATKRVCEMIVQHLDTSSKCEFVSVRFGNVLAASGSVIPRFKSQIAAGGPVRVTHKDITRYYMTVTEAVNLVLCAGDMAVGGEIYVLDMGSPIRTLDLAHMLIRLSGLEPGRDIDIEITGLRPGEKLYEELLMAEEGLKKTPNNKIFVGRPVKIGREDFLESLEELRAWAYAESVPPADVLVRWLGEVVPEFVGGGAIATTP